MKFADLSNNISKRAQKRAFVAAILMATRASFFFMQGDEDRDDSPAQPPKNNSTNPTDFNAVITEKQTRLIWAKAKAAKIPDDVLAQTLKEVLPYTVGEDGKPHLSKIHTKDLTELIKWIDGYQK